MIERYSREPMRSIFSDENRRCCAKRRCREAIR